MSWSSESVAVKQKRRQLRHVSKNWRDRLQVVVGQVQSRKPLQSAESALRRIDFFNLVIARENDLKMNQLVNACGECREAIVGDVNFTHRNHEPHLVRQRFQVIAAQIEVLDVIELRHEWLNFRQQIRVHVEL